MKIALITGANSGIGFYTSIELLKAGFVVVATMRDISKQAALVKEVELLGLKKALYIQQMDITKKEEIINVKNMIEEKFGSLDILINNAGYCQGGLLAEITYDEWEAQQKTNLLGTLQVTKVFLPLLEKKTPSQIINLSSVSGFFGFPGMSAYTSSKFAIEGLSESLRLELLPKQIFVTLIEPASYKTKIWEKGLANITDQGDDFKQNLFKYAKASANNGSDPIEVALLVVKICQTNKPKFRYPIGKGARTLAFLKRVLPWSIIEKIVLNRLR